MKTIYKYPLGDWEGLLQLPQRAVILHTDFQNGAIVLWASVDTSNPLEGREFRVVGTGHELPENEYQYIGTVKDHNFVWHVFVK